MYQKNFPPMRERHTIQAQLFQIKEEVDEVAYEVDEIRKANRRGNPVSNAKLLVELMDIIHAVETMFDDVGASQEQLDRAKDEVIRKNTARKYYSPFNDKE